ncbi:hypothetical protein [Longimicrobium sp.]|uniref:hypothetical protein n=1 Tax=Longimicrobium sp. TaxID=2029185 RepID=UPI002EDB24CE
MRSVTGRATRWTLAAALALALAAGARAEARGQEPPPAAAQEPGIYPVLFVTGETAAGATVELHLKRVGVDDRIASFQGELVYDPARLTVSAGQIPQGITGSWHQARPGTLRFAGVALAGIDAGPVLTLTVAATRPLAADDFALTLEEVVSATGFRNLVSRVRQDGTHPALSRVRP